MNAVEVRGLSKIYRIGQNAQGSLRDAVRSRFRTVSPSTIWALRDVNMSVPRGEVLGIIGRNGAGKSTLLKIISQVTLPSHGEVLLRGRVGALLEVGTGFHPELTGRENVFLNGTILGMTRDEIRRRFDTIVEFSGVEAFLDTPIKRYSSGMQLRLAFAVAAHLEPEIMIVDEVLAVGDAEFQRRCLGRIGELAGEGRTVIFVSHDTGAVTRLCSRAIWLQEGSVLREGGAREIVDAYWRSLSLSTRVAGGVARRVGDIELLEASMAGDGALGGHRLVRGQAMTATARLFLHSRMDGMDFAFSVTDSLGTRILYEALSDSGSPPPNLEGGEHVLRMSLPALLPTGEYTLGLWAYANGHPSLEEPVLTFDVRPAPDDPIQSVVRQRLIQPEGTRWTLAPAGESSDP